MSEKHHIIPVWFFVGVMLLVYGIVILASGLVEWPHPPATVLSNLHATTLLRSATESIFPPGLGSGPLTRHPAVRAGLGTMGASR